MHKLGFRIVLNHGLKLLATLLLHNVVGVIGGSDLLI
jgi:hypothetical protein